MIDGHFLGPLCAINCPELALLIWEPSFADVCVVVNH